MMYSLRQELLSELNLIKGVLKEAEDAGEVHRDERVKIMASIGQIKTVLYDNSTFRNTYIRQEFRMEKMVVGKCNT